MYAVHACGSCVCVPRPHCSKFQTSLVHCDVTLLCCCCCCAQVDLVRLQEQLRVAEGRQARVGAVAASELEAALASVSGACLAGLVWRACQP